MNENARPPREGRAPACCYPQLKPDQSHTFPRRKVTTPHGRTQRPAATPDFCGGLLRAAHLTTHGPLAPVRPTSGANVLYLEDTTYAHVCAAPSRALRLVQQLARPTPPCDEQLAHATPCASTRRRPHAKSPLPGPPTAAAGSSTSTTPAEQRTGFISVTPLTLAHDGSR